MKKTNTFIR